MLLASSDYWSRTYISAWALALLVSTCKAFLRASNREASSNAKLHAFFVPKQ